MNVIDNIFNNLDSFRKLPAYQLERRADIFIQYYLEKGLNKQLKAPDLKFILPEFPLKKLINKSKDDWSEKTSIGNLERIETGYSSVNADYILWSKEKKKLYLIIDRKLLFQGVLMSASVRRV